MNRELMSFLTLLVFNTSRRLYVLGQILRSFPPDAFGELRGRIERAIAADREAQVLESRWRGVRGGNQHAPGMRELDTELDRALGALNAALTATQSTFGVDGPRGRAARLAKLRLFPDDMRQLIHLPYMEQAEAVQGLLWRIEHEPELAEALRTVEAQAYVDRVAELNARYTVLLDSSRRDVDYAEVQRARRAGQERLCRIVFQLGARLDREDTSPEEAEVLDQALQFVLEQNERIRRHHQRRRTAGEVDPETGEELDFEVEDDELDGEDDAFDGEDDVEFEDAFAGEDDAAHADAPPVAQPMDPDANAGAA